MESIYAVHGCVPGMSGKTNRKDKTVILQKCSPFFPKVVSFPDSVPEPIDKDVLIAQLRAENQQQKARTAQAGAQITKGES
jgi:hypothetical protein